jgi:cell division topological specificity factor
MNLMGFFNRRASAPVARERLQILLAHERGIVGGKPDLVSILREEIVAVVAKHVTIERDKVQVRIDRGDALSTLEIEVEILAPPPAGHPAPDSAMASASPVD